MNNGNQIPIDLPVYTSIMRNIQHRSYFISRLFEDENAHINFGGLQVGDIRLETLNEFRIETITLQIRKIIEAIGIASIAANKSVAEQQYKKFDKEWNIKRIFNEIESINPNFYPKPLKTFQTDMPGIKFGIEEVKGGFMSRNEIMSVYAKCSKILHFRNIYDKKDKVVDRQDFLRFKRQVEKWMKRIKNLLAIHNIGILDDDRYIVILLADNEVNSFEFTKNRSL